MKLMVGGKEIKGLYKAEVKIYHNNPKAPDPYPTMDWVIETTLQFEDVLALWALAPQDKTRWKKCDLEIQHSDKSTAHKWSLLNAYIHEYQEVEHRNQDQVSTGAGGGGFYLRLVIRGKLLDGVDYDGKNIETIAAGSAPANAS